MSQAKRQKLQATANKKVEIEGVNNERGVILLSHIPHGFYEQQMFDFFSQFGEVTRLKLIRSKKTGRSKHIAFIEFEFEAIAKIAAETMDNYLMFQKILKCKLIPPEELKPSTFVNWNREFRLSKNRAKAKIALNKVITDPEKIQKRKASNRARRASLQKKLKDLGVDYDVMNIKVNESFVVPERPRASKEDVEKLRRHGKRNAENNKDAQKDRKRKISEQNETAEKIEKEDERKEEDVGVKEEDSKTEDFEVMVTDLNDSEITFMSPPPEARIKRKSIGIAKKKKENLISPDDNSEYIEWSEHNINTALEDYENIASEPKQEELEVVSPRGKIRRSRNSVSATARKKRLEKRKKLNKTM